MDFISLEVQAAKEAGMDAVVVVRPGNAPLTRSEREAWRVVDSFDALLV